MFHHWFKDIVAYWWILPLVECFGEGCAFNGVTLSSLVSYLHNIFTGVASNCHPSCRATIGPQGKSRDRDSEEKNRGQEELHINALVGCGWWKTLTTFSLMAAFVARTKQVALV